jgi:hypothetical protein
MFAGYAGFETTGLQLYFINSSAAKRSNPSLYRPATDHVHLLCLLDKLTYAYRRPLVSSLSAATAPNL